jgi:8-hydroxy-5-deazaflavin:NADPH oxidoreductase
MRIGIIGSGNIGGALTRRLRALGHDVAVANSRGPASLASLTNETGATVVAVEDVAKGRDLVVVAIPLCRIPELRYDILADTPVVIDTSNYYPRQRDGLIAEIEGGVPESRWVEQHLRRPVIKAFNSILADHLRDKGLPAGAPGRIALAVAGDEAEAKATTMGLIDELGFDPVDGGTIAESWRQQPGTPGYLRDLSADGVRQALADASPERGAEWRATPKSPGTFASPA